MWFSAVRWAPSSHIFPLCYTDANQSPSDSTIFRSLWYLWCRQRRTCETFPCGMDYWLYDVHILMFSTGYRWLSGQVNEEIQFVYVSKCTILKNVKCTVQKMITGSWWMKRLKLWVTTISCSDTNLLQRNRQDKTNCGLHATSFCISWSFMFKILFSCMISATFVQQILASRMGCNSPTPLTSQLTHCLHEHIITVKASWPV